MKGVTEIEKSRLNPQIQILPEERQTLYHTLFTYIHTLGLSSPYNMALPYKLFYAISCEDETAIQEYSKLCLDTYSLEFFEYYLYNYVLLYPTFTRFTLSAYACTDEHVPNKQTIADRVLQLLDEHDCYNDELLGKLIEVCVE